MPLPVFAASTSIWCPPWEVVCHPGPLVCPPQGFPPRFGLIPNALYIACRHGSIGLVYCMPVFHLRCCFLVSVSHFLKVQPGSALMSYPGSWITDQVSGPARAFFRSLMVPRSSSATLASLASLLNSAKNSSRLSFWQSLLSAWYASSLRFVLVYAYLKFSMKLSQRISSVSWVPSFISSMSLSSCSSFQESTCGLLM